VFTVKTVDLPMKTAAKLFVLTTFAAGLALCGCSKSSSPQKIIQSPEVRAHLQPFAKAKEAQSRSLAAGSKTELPPEFGAFFSAIQDSDWETISNKYFEMKKLLNSFKSDQRAWWQPVVETYGAGEQFTVGSEKYASAFGSNIIQSIPAGSIYFGGTDPGRFIITAMQKSQIDGDPFFTLTQNALADGTYLDYLRSMYGDKIYIPTAENSQKCFNDYYEDVQKRARNNQLKPGENVTVSPSGRMEISGQVAVMEINGLLVKMIFDRETNREFYVEESFPLDWMYPHLEPHGLIFKLNHESQDKLSDEIIRRDHDYWTNTVALTIGDWLNEDTSVTNIAAFAEKVFLQHDLSGFQGDPEFVQNDYAHRMFSKLRSSIAGLYVWRASHPADESEKDLMNNEADFAFRQAWALCPNSPEAVFRYTQFLTSQDRYADALLVAETAAKFPPVGDTDKKQIDDLVASLKRYQK
jgi:hypothetical protein